MGKALSPPALRSPLQSVKNVAWNLVGGAWAGGLIVLATPLYVSRLGLEGYGILGLWLMMQVMMGLLDAGMGAALLREFAGARRDEKEREARRDLLRSLETVHWAIALLVTMLLALSAGWLGSHWLKAHALPDSAVGNAIRLMALALGLQFPYALYSSGLAGLQEHRRMIVLQMVGNTLRYGGGAAVLVWRADLAWFFTVQILVAGAMTFAIRRVLWGLIHEDGAVPAVFRMEMLHRVWRFSIGMAMTSISAVLLANADRVALSRMVPTAELGVYSIAFTATGLLQLGIQPFYRVFFPRYSELVSIGDARRLRGEYFRSCGMMASVILPLGIIGWTFAPQLFRIWLGKYDESLVTTFRWLLVGITCSGLAWLPAAFQQAHGWTRLHVAMITGALLLGTPVMLWAIREYGPVGGTAIWLVHGISDITLGLWLMHRRLLIGELPAWYGSVVAPPLAFGLLLAGVSFWLMPHDLGRWVSLTWIGGTGAVVVAASLLFQLAGDRRSSFAHSNRRGN